MSIEVATIPTFNTIQYCLDNNIASFTFMMDHTKSIEQPWKHINNSNFKSYITAYENGFAIITDGQYIVVDFDIKHSPPQYIYDKLHSQCNAVEKTPGGYHFWYKVDNRTAHIQSETDIFWGNSKIKGLDVRAKGGIAFCSPTRYITIDNEDAEYIWIKGNLSSAREMPSEILELLTRDSTVDTKDPDTVSIAYSKAETTYADDIQAILDILSPDRVNSYSGWINVGIALYNSGYTCDIWDEWSKKSNKYKISDCSTKWRSFKDRTDNRLTKASIYFWAKQDNPTAYKEIQSKNDSVLNAFLIGSHAHIAHVFYTLNPNRYLLSQSYGWFILKDNNTWEATGQTDITKIPSLFNTICNECSNILSVILSRLTMGSQLDTIKQKQLADTLRKLSSAAFLKGVVAFLPGYYHKDGIDKLLNQRRNLFAFNNGVLDMITKEFRNIMPEDYISITCGYDYIPITASQKSMVLDFIRSIFPNENVVKYILTILSTSLDGNNRWELFHALTGIGANGKSCLMDLCKVAFGDYFRTIKVSYLTKDDEGKDKAMPDLVDAQWTRILVTSESEVKDKFQIGMLKLITGQDEVSCRAMYGKNLVKYVPQFKLWIMTNELPRLSGFDSAIQRRMRCVNFPMRFVSNPRADNEKLRDDTLKIKIGTDPSWKYGFIGLLIDAYLGYDAPSPAMPDDIANFTQEYMLENNPVGAWLYANYEITNHRADIIQRTELYNQFIAASDATMTQKAFARAMVQCNIQERKTGGIIYYYGIRQI